MKIILFAAIITTLIGCASAGSTLSQSDIDTIQKNVTTEQAMLTRFGPPGSKKIDANGVKHYVWTYAYSSHFSAVDVKVLSVTINTHGVVDSYDVSIRK